MDEDKSFLDEVLESMWRLRGKVKPRLNVSNFKNEGWGEGFKEHPRTPQQIGVDSGTPKRRGGDIKLEDLRPGRPKPKSKIKPMEKPKVE